MVTIATFNEQSKAKHLRERLGQAGVSADIIGEGHLPACRLYVQTAGKREVKVDEKDFEKAQGLMVEWEKSDPEIGTALRCPQCGSSEAIINARQRRVREFFL